MTHTPGSAKQEYYLELLKDVWYDEGPQPWYHRQVKRWLHKKWPLLYAAVKGLVGDDS